MKKVPVVVFCISFFLILVTSAPEFTNCPTSPLCINEPITYQCNVTGSANTLQWRVFNATGGILNAIQYGSGISVGSPGSIGTQFATNLTSRDGGSIVSTITFTTAMDIHNYTVECVAILFDSVSNTISTIGTDNCSILVQDVLPDAPVPTISAINPNNYTVSWPPSTSPCFSSYIVNVTSAASNINETTTDASLIIPISRSTYGTEYSISVVAVDTGGRSMDQQGIIKFTPNVPPAVTNFAVIQTSPEDDDIVNITVSWNEPSTSAPLNVLSYIVYHNVTDPDTSITIPAPTTTYDIPDATVGSVYTVGVAAVNVLGTGDNATAIISILSTVVPTSSSMTVSSTPSTETTDTSTSFITETSVAPSTSVAPTDDTTGTDDTLYIAVGAGAGVFVIVIIIVVIIVGYLVWRKSKGEKANFDQRRDSTEPIALVDKKDHGSSPATGQPIYQEAMSSEDIQREAAPTTGELYAQPNKGSVRRPPPQPQSELATYQDPSTIQRTQAPNVEYLYAEVDKSKPQQQQAVYAQVDKEKKGGDGTVYADLDLKNTQGGPVTGSNPANVIYSDVHNN